MRPIDDIFARLPHSAFRSRFRLQPRECSYLEGRGLATVLTHARDFIEQRLAPPEPKNDGRQTPMRGHPVFVAQHATATCCRSCLAKWHDIPERRVLTERQIVHILAVIERWLRLEAARTTQRTGVL